MLRFPRVAPILLGALLLTQSAPLFAEDKPQAVAETAGGATTAGSASAAVAGAETKSKFAPYAVLLKDTQQVSGLLTLHRKESTLYAELSPGSSIAISSC